MWLRGAIGGKRGRIWGRVPSQYPVIQPAVDWSSLAKCVAVITKIA
jgi:hypothetical protein